MGFLDWLLGWKPEKYKWYRFFDRGKSLNEPNLNLEGDRLKIKPYSYIKGKKHRAKFYVTKNYCEIIAGKHKLIVPIKRCSFRKKLKQYFQGQSRVDEYYITLVVSNVSKEDYDRYKKFKKDKDKIYTCKNCGYHQGVSWDRILRKCKGCGSKLK